jgi:hypothetical protein
MEKETIITTASTKAIVYNNDDGVKLSFLPSSIEDAMWHIIIEFVALKDYDYNYLSTAEVLEIYSINL